MDTNTNPAAQPAIIRYSYEGTPIAFSNKKDVMVNATQMAKPFGKQPIKWLETNQSKSYIEELAKLRKRSLTDLVHVKKGGHNAGTWMHQDVALEFARWLSPKFAIWTNDRIRELLLQGHTTLSNDTLSLTSTIRILTQRIEILEHENTALRIRGNSLEKSLLVIGGTIVSAVHGLDQQLAVSIKEQFLNISDHTCVNTNPMLLKGGNQ